MEAHNLSSVYRVCASGDEGNCPRIIRFFPGSADDACVLRLGHDYAQMSMCAATIQGGDRDFVGVENASCHLNVFKGQLMVDFWEDRIGGSVDDFLNRECMTRRHGCWLLVCEGRRLLKVRCSNIINLD
jgi:hypothetical protein